MRAQNARIRILKPQEASPLKDGQGAYLKRFGVALRRAQRTAKKKPARKVCPMCGAGHYQEGTTLCWMCFSEVTVENPDLDHGRLL
jgi:hypothetical protein